jgi:hypothetical protein
VRSTASMQCPDRESIVRSCPPLHGRRLRRHQSKSSRQMSSIPGLRDFLRGRLCRKETEAAVTTADLSRRRGTVDGGCRNRNGAGLTVWLRPASEHCTPADRCNNGRTAGEKHEADGACIEFHCWRRKAWPVGSSKVVTEHATAPGTKRSQQADQDEHRSDCLEPDRQEEKVTRRPPRRGWIQQLHDEKRGGGGNESELLRQPIEMDGTLTVTPGDEPPGGRRGPRDDEQRLRDRALHI